MSIWTSLFWKDAAERVLSTVAQVLIAILSVDGLDLIQLDLEATLTTVLVAGGLALLKAIVANAAVGRAVSPASLVPDDRGIQ